MFAVGNKHRIQDAVTHADYRNKMAALMDAGFPNRSAYVQAGVDDVASHLRPADPAAPDRALVVFPEDAGFVNILIGSRGAAARRAPTALSAIPSLFQPYSRQVAYYAEKYPGQGAVRLLFLALTDTLYRSFYETFRDLAREHGVYIAAAMNAAPAKRVEASEDPGLVALLGDPDEPGRDYVYEATSPYPGNTTYVFAPDGEVLVPDGMGGTRQEPVRDGRRDPRVHGEGLPDPARAAAAGRVHRPWPAFGSVPDLEVLDTPVGRLATVISKDAWMIDVNDRFEAKGANVILQPEAFSDWGFRTDEWAPDVFKEGGFANLQKYPAWQTNVDASLTGNFFDITFDGQSTIIGRRTKGDPGPLGPENAWIGQNPDTGFRTIGPWIVPDPGIADPSLTLRRAPPAARRRRREAPDRAALPGLARRRSVPERLPREHRVGRRDGSRRPGHGAVRTRRGPRPPPSRAASRVSGKEKQGPVTQHAPRVAAHGRYVYAVWHEQGAGLANVFLAVSRNHGKTLPQAACA